MYSDKRGLSAGDNTRAMHWVGDLLVGDSIFLQFKMFSMNIADNTTSWGIWDSSRGGQRLSAVYLRPSTP